MYVYDTKEGYEDVRKVVKCKRCFSDKIIYKDGKYICYHCGTEFKEE